MSGEGKEMTAEQVQELVNARMAVLQKAAAGSPGSSAAANAAKVASDVRKKAETKHKTASEQLDHLQRELVKAVCLSSTTSHRHTSPLSLPVC